MIKRKPQEKLPDWLKSVAYGLNELDETQKVQPPSKQLESEKEPIDAQAPAPEKAFEPFPFLQKLLHPKRLKNSQKLKNIKAEEVEEVCKAAREMFKKEGSLLEVGVPINVVGDVHGNFHDLYRALLARTNQNIIDEIKSSVTIRAFGRERFLFLGDYINNGNRSIECICLVLAMKINFPERVFVLRGSQEGPIGKQFSKALIQFAPIHAEVLVPLFEEVFSWMPLAAVVGGKIFCVHGGLSPHLNSLEDIKLIKRPLMDVKKNDLATDLLFSDPLDYEFIHIPYTEATFEGNYLRHKGVLFNEATVNEFLAKTGMKLIVRSATMTRFGYRFFADKKLITIFNSTGYKREGNCGALLKIDKEGKIAIITLLPMPSKKKHRTNGAKARDLSTEAQTVRTVSSSASERAAMNTETF